MKLGPVRITDREPIAPGLLEVTKNDVYVGTATHPVRLGEVKAFGKKQMPAADWARGVKIEPGTVLGV
jgi:methionyl-tRNA formyltransferase